MLLNDVNSHTNKLDFVPLPTMFSPYIVNW